MNVRFRTGLLAAAVAILGSTSLLAQGVTTAAVGGLVTDVNGTPLAGAQVTALHTASGSNYAAATRSDGRFAILGMRVGGPYRVTVSYVGYQRQTREGVYLTLGVAADLRFQMQALTVQVEAITVMGDRDAIFSSDRTGAATAVPTEALDALPTISRRVEDFLRLAPQYSSASFGFSFAGQDNRLNNMTVDGSYFNNSFGLAGQPGDRTGVAPISLDAIEAVQVNVAPYDVRQGNFVGAGINMVTRSGTNDFRGSLSYSVRNEGYVGDFTGTRGAGGSDFDAGTFSFSQFGATLGGPILRNRLFFFASYEGESNTSPGTLFRANTGTEPVANQTTRVLASDLDALSSYLSTNFGYNTGPYQGYDFNVPAKRFMARLDYNISDRSKVSLRYQLLNSSTDVLVSNSSSLGRGSRRGTLNSLNFQASNYSILENLRSIIGEWNVTFGNNRSNSLILGYTSSDESRGNNQPPWFPLVEIREGGNNYTTFGFEPFTPANALLYHSYQFQDNFNLFMGNHSLTFGVSVEKYRSENVFFPGAQSVYVYNSLAEFYTDANAFLAACGNVPSAWSTCSAPTTSPITLNRFQVRYSNIPGLSEPLQPLDVTYSGIYAQDEWRPTRDLTLTGGLRIDRPSFGNTGFDNAVADGYTFRNADGSPIQYNTGKLPDANLLVSPRFGFNYDVQGRGRTQLRGGTGIFTGRPAYVWISNQVGNTGVLTGFDQIDGTNTRPFNPDPDHYKPTAVTGAPAASFQLALTDPNFRFPQVWRSNIAVDQRLPWGLLGTAEFLYSSDVNGIAYINANLPAPQSAFVGADTRPRYVCPAGGCPAGSTQNRIYSNVSDATVLTNQAIGHAWNLSFAVERPFTNGLFLKVAYSYGESENTVDPGSIASGSFSNNLINRDANNPTLGYSAYSPGHRLFTALSYRRDFFGFGATTVALFWEGHTGGSGSYAINGDMNGDGARNDLVYIPRDTSEMNFEAYSGFTVAQQVAAWEAFIEQDPYLREHRGQIAKRGAVFLPMLYRTDLSISQDVGRAMGGRPQRLQVRLDILNFMNLLNSSSGRGQRMVSTTPLQFRSVDATGAAVYRLASFNNQLISRSFEPTTGLGDVYRLQLSLRYYFNQ